MLRIHVICVQENKRDDFRKFLDRLNIPTAIYYPYILPEQECLGKETRGKFPVAKKASKTNVALPIAYLNDKEMNQVQEAILAFYRGV